MKSSSGPARISLLIIAIWICLASCRYSTPEKMVSKLWTKSEFKFSGQHQVHLYKSARSGLRVAVGDVPGPMVKGVISFVTETDNNAGLPHTLEHLVFMGSKKYPYKGVLDIIANRCLASGTNAWTDQDHTAYTLSTVGSEGFLKVLPIYINHLLEPTLSKEQFATEVHHITGDGEDGGVVYSEMQDHESDMENIMHIKAQSLLYPPNNPYGVNTGGELRYLREACTVEKCRDFHKRFYHLNNMLISIAGRIDHERLLQLVSDVESEYSPAPFPFPRPFSFTLPPLKESVENTVICPSDDASRGTVDISWFGPSAIDLETTTALSVLFDYMEHTTVAPLQKDFVNIPDPLASNASFSTTEQVSSLITLRFSGVPTEKLKEVKSRFVDKTLREHCEAAVFDMERIGFVIEQQILNDLAQAENKPHDEIFQHLIGHQLYGKDDDALLNKRLNEIETLSKLKSEPATFWAGLVRKYLAAPSVTIIGQPDEDMVEKIAKKEMERISAQKNVLGDEGLLKAADDLQQAISKNTAVKPPAEVLDELIVSDLENFDRFTIVSQSNGNGSSGEHFLSQFPFPATLHKANTKFVQMWLLMDTGALTAAERAWLMLFCELMFESPAHIDGKLHSAEDVAKLYTRDLVDHSVAPGIGGYFDRIVSLVLKVDASRFGNLAKWAEVFTHGVVYDAKRVKSVAQRLASDARERKRDGCDVAATLITSMCYENGSTAATYDAIVLEKMHEKIAKMCTSDPTRVQQKLDQVRAAILARGVNAHIVCDPTQVENGQWPSWDALSVPGTQSFKCSMGETVANDSAGKNIVIGVGGSESSFIYQSSVTGVDWQSAELVPLMLLTQYLSQTEGPLWRAVRGDGLAYGANIYTKPDRKMLTLSLYRCANPVQAYEQTRKIVESILSSGHVDESELEAAKRSLVFELMQKEESVFSAGRQQVLAAFRGIHPDFTRELCARVWNSTADEVLSVGGPFVGDLFKNYARAVTVHPSKLNEVKKNFNGIKAENVSWLQIKTDF